MEMTRIPYWSLFATAQSTAAATVESDPEPALFSTFSPTRAAPGATPT